MRSAIALVASAIVIALGLLSCGDFRVRALTCIGDGAEPLDWSVMMKVPKMSNSNPTVTAGLAYGFMDVNTPFSFSSKSIGQNADAAANTLAQLYGSDPSAVGWILYNDEGASGPTCGYCGHTKGVLGFDANGAFWLVHSVPQYPPVVSGGGQYSYPASGTIYGQSFLCVSLPFSALNQVAYQYLFTAPGIYDSNLPSSMASQLPGIAAVINKQHITVSNQSISQFVTVGGASFIHFAKTASWGRDLYEDMVAPYWGDNLYIETWMRPKLSSFCPPTYQFAVMDVDTVTLFTQPLLKWTETHDHSKWAVSQSASVGVVCIGDINHQTSQFARAGGTLCFQNSTVYTTFQAFVTSADNC